MRLQFNLKKIKISPVCHIQINRHAEEFQNRYAAGELYGALYNDEADITNVLPFPDAEKLSSKEDLEAMEKRHEEHLKNYEMDTSNLGWYMVCYKQNFWDELEAVHFYEKCISTSFFLIYDYKARVKGMNPYKAYRLSDEFALAQKFSWKDLKNFDPVTNNPFVEIPIVVQKNQYFECLMMYNRESFLKDFKEKRKLEADMAPKQNLTSMIEEYIETLDEHIETEKVFSEYINKEPGVDRPVSVYEYADYVGHQLKINEQEKNFQKYFEELKVYEKLASQYEQ